jgi:hypothetical protein
MALRTHNLFSEHVNTIRTGHLNCWNACSQGLNNLIQLSYSFLKNLQQFANYFCVLKFLRKYSPKNLLVLERVIHLQTFPLAERH